MTSKESTFARVLKIIEEIRPYVQTDGGDVELVAVEDNIVQLRLHGACTGCPSAQMTLKLGIERRIQEEIPEIKEVIAVE